MFTRFIAPAVVLLATSVCGAQQMVEQDDDAAVVEPPIIIDSDTNQYDLRSGVTRFSDNVTIQRGAMRVNADEGAVHQADGEITLVELFGSPTTWRDRLDDGSVVEGQARQIRFEVAENIVTLIGDARLQHEQGRFTGDELVYDLDTESLAGRGSSDNQARVILEGDSMRRGASGDDPGVEPDAAGASAAEDAAASGPEAETEADADGEGGGDGEAAAQPESDNGEADTEASETQGAGGADRAGAGNASASDPDETEDDPADPPALH